MNNELLPEVSVVVPVYKTEKYLSACIDSILTQQYKAFELLLVIDGKENVGECVICESYEKQDSRIRVFCLENNEGVCVARNTGIRNARGKYVTFIDSDDTVEPDYLQMLIPRNDVDVVYSGFKLINNDNSFYVFKYHTLQESTSYSDICYLDQHVLLNGPYCKLYRTSMLIDNNIFFKEGWPVTEDTMFNFAMIPYIRVFTNIDYCGYNYFQRIRVDSITNKKFKYQFYWYVAQHLLEARMDLFNRSNQKDPDYYKFIWETYFRYILWAFPSLYALNNNYNRKERLRIIRSVFNSECFQKALDQNVLTDKLAGKVYTYCMRGKHALLLDAYQSLRILKKKYKYIKFE